MNEIKRSSQYTHRIKIYMYMNVSRKLGKINYWYMKKIELCIKKESVMLLYVTSYFM